MATNYQRLLGSPRDAAETLSLIAAKCDGMECGPESCDGCPLDATFCLIPEVLVKWLESEVEE